MTAVKGTLKNKKLRNEPKIITKPNIVYLLTSIEFDPDLIRYLLTDIMMYVTQTKTIISDN